MHSYRTRKQSGFTLVEILIVVIILGILAAIVIPQFTNASQDARKNSLTSQLQTIRSQLELYKLQHKDQMPPSLGSNNATDWDEMTSQTDADHAAYVAGTSVTGPFGPYLQQPPMNSLNQSTFVAPTASDFGSGGAGYTAVGTEGFVCNLTTGKVWATSSLRNHIFNEADPSDPNNDD
jgi:general secretion pathway protein G